VKDVRASRREFSRMLAAGLTLAVTRGEGLGAESGSGHPSFDFGVVADAQYCDAEPAGSRYYRQSLEKLAQCVQSLNRQDLSFTVHLGDFIDRDFESFNVLLPIYEQLRSPCYHVLGNHDFSVAPDKLAAVPGKLKMPRRYYDFSVPGWRFIVLDGNDLSLIAYQPGTDAYDRSMSLYRSVKEQGAVNARSWNGAVSESQLAWLEQRLNLADQRREHVVIFCHFPVYPENSHNLWNDHQVRDMLAAHRSVVAFLNGHNHAGGYACQAGIHYVTLPGMVETRDTTAYAIVHVAADALRITGHGRAPDRQLTKPAS
jgi:manganese-dependent ADP-ribose/CDP-alcohol diphosphatase